MYTAHNAAQATQNAFIGRQRVSHQLYSDMVNTYGM